MGGYWRLVVSGVSSENRSTLDLLGAPTGVRLSHVGRGLNRRNEFQRNVAETDETDHRAGNVAEDVAVQKKAADKDVDWTRLLAYGRIGILPLNQLTATTSKERKEERCITVNVVRDLRKEFEAADNCVVYY